LDVGCEVLLKCEIESVSGSAHAHRVGTTFDVTERLCSVLRAIKLIALTPPGPERKFPNITLPLSESSTSIL
jgi:hypothetical protein